MPKKKIQYKNIGEYRVEVTDSEHELHPYIYKIESPIYRNAKLVSTNGKWYTRINRNGRMHRRSTPFQCKTLHEESIRRAMSLLHSRYDVIYGFSDDPGLYEANERPTMVEVIVKYNKAHAKDSPASKKHLANAVQFFFKEDFIAEEEELRNRVRHIIHTTDVSNDTVAKYLTYVKKIAMFAVDERIFKTNPLLSLKVKRPSKVQNSKVLPTRKELSDVMRFLEKPFKELNDLISEIKKSSSKKINFPKTNFEANRRFIKILEQTAMRPVELAKLEKKDIEERGFIIRSEKTGNRMFAYLEGYFEGLKDIIEEQIDSTRGKLLFPHVKYRKHKGYNEPIYDEMRYIWNGVQMIAGIDKPYRLYDLRSIAINRWEKEYGFRTDIINDLAGNSEFIRIKHYRASMNIDDLYNKAKHGLT